MCCAFPWPGRARGRGPGRTTPAAGAGRWGRRVPSSCAGWEPPASRVRAGATAGWIWPRRRARRCGRPRPAGSPSRAGSRAAGARPSTLTGTGDPPLRTTYEPVRAAGARGRGGERRARWWRPWRRGRPTAASGCLHWGLLRGTEYLDPLSLLPPWLLRRRPSRLLPVFGVPAARVGRRRGRRRRCARRWPRRQGLGRHGVAQAGRCAGPRCRCAVPAADWPTGRAAAARPGAPGARRAAAVHRRAREPDGPAARAQPRTPRRAIDDRRVGDRRRVLRRTELDPAHRRVHDALQQHRRQPGLLVAQLAERLDDHRDQPAVRGTDLLPRPRVQLARGDRDHGPVPPVADQRPAAGARTPRPCPRPSPPLHRGLDLRRPDREVDGAQLLDDRRPGAEVLVDGGPGEARALGEGGEGQRLRTALGQQGACGVQQGAALHRPVLGHGGRSNPWHASTVRMPSRMTAGDELGGPQRPTSASFARSCRTDLVWIWLTRLSVTPRTLPISARVSPS